MLGFFWALGRSTYFHVPGSVLSGWNESFRQEKIVPQDCLVADCFCIIVATTKLQTDFTARKSECRGGLLSFALFYSISSVIIACSTIFQKCNANIMVQIMLLNIDSYGLHTINLHVGTTCTAVCRCIHIISNKHSSLFIIHSVHSYGIPNLAITLFPFICECIMRPGVPTGTVLPEQLMSLVCTNKPPICLSDILVDIGWFELLGTVWMYYRYYQVFDIVTDIDIVAFVFACFLKSARLLIVVYINITKLQDFRSPQLFLCIWWYTIK